MLNHLNAETAVWLGCRTLCAKYFLDAGELRFVFQKSLCEDKRVCLCMLLNIHLFIFLPYCHSLFCLIMAQICAVYVYRHFDVYFRRNCYLSVAYG